jgi:trehalose utilization protein
MEAPTRVLVWNEYRRERRGGEAADMYPGGIHAVLAKVLAEAGFEVRTAVLDEPEHGLSAEALARTDVLLWWGHEAHDAVADDAVDRVQARVLDGMGLIALHSSHFSKLFRRMMGTSCGLSWRVEGEREHLWVVDPGHPIARGLPSHLTLDREEVYAEPFDIPSPDELVFLGWFKGGEVFRSGCCWRRGRGRVFYFQPGHETFPSYHHPLIRRVLVNAVGWAAPRPEMAPLPVGRRDPLEPQG